MNIAIITGASSGMGREFVRNLDDFEYDEIWGIALDTLMLEKVKKETKTKFISYNLDLTKEESFAVIERSLKLKKAKVHWLVNASGFGKFGRYDEIKMESALNMIDLNCKALVHLTNLVIPYMIDGGRIVQFGSVAGFQPVPYVNVYAATKAFVISYSRGLNVELKHRNISVTCVAPYWTRTNFFNRATEIDSKTGENVVSKYVTMYEPEKVIKKALNDALKRKEMSVCGIISKSQQGMTKLLPHKLVMKVWTMQQRMNEKYKDTK